MLKSSLWAAASVAAATSLLPSLATAQRTVVLPVQAQGNEGSETSSIPFFRDTRSARLQQSYPDQVWADAGVFFPIVIIGMRFRANGGEVVATGSQYGGTTVSMSTMPFEHTQLTDTFASNHGADLTVCFTGPVDITPTSGNTPNDFYNNIQFTMPFTYDPTNGDDLLVELQSDGSLFTGVDGARMDFVPGSFSSRAFDLVDNNAAMAATLQTTTGAPVVEMTFVPAPGLYPEFSADAQTGTTGATIQFTDGSVSSTVGGVTSWAWDLDGDGNVDSNAQNPTFTYNSPGTFDVTLTVDDGANGPQTISRTAFIEIVDPANPGTPEELQFQFNEVRGDVVANSATNGLAPAFGTVSSNPWQGDPGLARIVSFGANEPGVGMVAGTGSAGDGIVDTGHAINIVGSMTVSWWQRVIPATTAPGFPRFMFGGSGGTGSRCFTGQAAGAGLIYRDGGGAGVLPDVTMSATTDLYANPDWSLITLVIDDTAGVATWYVDGVQNNQTVFTPGTHSLNNGSFIIGGHNNSARNYARLFDFDDFRLYTRALTLPEIQFLAAGTETAAATPWGFNCGGGAMGPPEIGGIGGDPLIGNAGFGVQLTNASPGALAIFGFGLFPVASGQVDLSSVFGVGCVVEIPLTVSVALVADGAGQLTIPLPIPNDPAVSGFHAYAQFLTVAGGQGAFTRALDIHTQ